MGVLGTSIRYFLSNTGLKRSKLFEGILREKRPQWNMKPAVAINADGVTLQQETPAKNETV